jgi:hypothetical protein
VSYGYSTLLASPCGAEYLLLNQLVERLMLTGYAGMHIPLADGRPRSGYSDLIVPGWGERLPGGEFWPAGRRADLGMEMIEKGVVGVQLISQRLWH